ncbi:uncharacterized protein TNCV_5065531 [Trichonephila clavipes]|nr:uncharacterized protein TNCV_5065531 [Trichonephila clavipes]
MGLQYEGDHGRKHVTDIVSDKNIIKMEKEKNSSQYISRCLTYICLLSLFVGSVALLGNTKSRAQCVLCDFYRFSATVLACNGKTSALMSNITSTEAVCIISNCLQQVRQGQPQFTGRRRRDASDVSKMIETSSDVDGLESAMSREFDNPNISSEKNDSADDLSSMKELLNQYTFMDERSAK